MLMTCINYNAAQTLQEIKIKGFFLFMYAALPTKCLLEKIANKSWHTHAFGKHNIYGKLQKKLYDCNVSHYGLHGTIWNNFETDIMCIVF